MRQQLNSETLDLFGKPRSVELTQEYWNAILVIAFCRHDHMKFSEESGRSRGTFKNLMGQIGGIMGEVSFLRFLSRCPGIRILHGLATRCDTGKCDMKIFVGGAWINAEIKTHLILPNKFLFMIYEGAHEISKQKGMDFYVPFISAFGSDVALMGRLLSPDDVDKWAVANHGYKTEPKEEPLNSICPLYFNDNFSAIETRLYDHKNLFGMPTRDINGLIERESLEFVDVDLFCRAGAIFYQKAYAEGYTSRPFDETIMLALECLKLAK